MAYSAQNHTAYFISTDGTAYTAVTSLLSVGGLNREANVKEVPNLDSTATPRISTGLVNVGDLSIECYHDDDDTGQTTMTSNIGATTYGRVEIDTDADGTADVTFDFTQILSKWELSGYEVEGVPTKVFTAKVDGDVEES